MLKLSAELMTQKPISKTFCALPWNHLYIDGEGRVLPCCHSMVPAETLRSLDPIHQVATLEEAWNSTFMRSLRLSLATENPPHTCNVCFESEKFGIPSHRQHTPHFPELAIERWLHHTEADGRVPLSIHSLDLRFANTCNLKCRMCKPELSSGLSAEFAKIHNFKTNSLLPPEERWYRKPGIWEKFSPVLPNLRYIHLAGGEPLIEPGVIDFLKHVISSGFSKQITLYFETNLTVLPKKLFELFPQFKGVRISCSLDGMGPLNEYVRYPSKWNTLVENLRKVESSHQELGLESCVIHVTAQVYNILSLTPLFEFLESNFRFVNPVARVGFVRFPHHFDARILPDPLKLRALESYRAFAQQHPIYEKVCKNLSRYLESTLGQEDPTALKEFFRVTEGFDRSRAQKLGLVCPELAEIKENY